MTVGGGEPTYQADFVLAFLKKCHENYLHVALDTCGYTTSPSGIKALEEADLVLFDIKGIALENHRKNTGVSNEIILSNLEHLDKIRKPIIIRLPIIPGYTDSKEDVTKTAKLLAGLKSVERVNLLAYHKYGQIKYEQLGRKYILENEPPSDARMNELKSFFEGYGLNIQLGG